MVTSGTGLTQEQGGPCHPIRTGDVIWYRPGIGHWRCAPDSNAMPHIVLQEADDGARVVWMVRQPTMHP